MKKYDLEGLVKSAAIKAMKNNDKSFVVKLPEKNYEIRIDEANGNDANGWWIIALYFIKSDGTAVPCGNSEAIYKGDFLSLAVISRKIKNYF